MGEPKLRLQGASQVYEGARGETRALQNMDIDVAPGEAVAILGPSGCGKSTSLLIAAGLRVPTQGAAFVDGVRVAGPRLNTALILQDFGLLPWKTVAENAGLGLQIRKTPKRERAERVARALEQVGLADFADAFPAELSGGMRQRLAMARALTCDADLLLMDEPLSNLDAKLRNQMRAEIIKLRQRIDTTFVYVTHDQTEAMTLGDRIVIMKDGVVQQVGTPQEVFDHPRNLFVAGFIGVPQMNYYDADLEVASDGSYVVDVDGTKFVPSEAKQQALRAAKVAPQPIILGVRPENISLATTGTVSYTHLTLPTIYSV